MLGALSSRDLPLSYPTAGGPRQEPSLPHHASEIQNYLETEQVGDTSIIQVSKSIPLNKVVPSLNELGTKEIKEKALMQRFGLSSQAAFRAGHPNSKRSTWRKEQDWVRPALMLTTPCLHAQLQASVTACHAAAFDRWERNKTIH